MEQILWFCFSSPLIGLTFWRLLWEPPWTFYLSTPCMPHHAWNLWGPLISRLPCHLRGQFYFSRSWFLSRTFNATSVQPWFSLTFMSVTLQSLQGVQAVLAYTKKNVLPTEVEVENASEKYRRTLKISGLTLSLTGNLKATLSLSFHWLRLHFSQHYRKYAFRVWKVHWWGFYWGCERNQCKLSKVRAIRVHSILISLMQLRYMEHFNKWIHIFLLENQYLTTIYLSSLLC